MQDAEGDGDDVLEPDHVTPYGIGAAFLLRTQEILEVVDERQVEFLQGDVVTAVHFRDELAQMPVYGTVAVVCSLHAAGAKTKSTFRLFSFSQSSCRVRG